MNSDSIPFEFIDKALETMSKTPQHTYLILTKRPQRMRKYFCEYIPQTRLVWPLPNVWLGVTCENQEMADKRIPILLQTPAFIRWVSYEPALGPLNLIPYLGHNAYKCECGWHDTEHTLHTRGYCRKTKSPEVAICKQCGKRAEIFRGLGWAVVGGESGPGARPCHSDWIRSLRDQCQAAGVPYFFKQHGEWYPFYDRDIDDPDWQNVPEENGKVRRLNLEGGHGFHGDRVIYFKRVGKKAAGRVLDNRIWDEMPVIGDSVRQRLSRY